VHGGPLVSSSSPCRQF